MLLRPRLLALLALAPLDTLPIEPPDPRDVFVPLAELPVAPAPACLPAAACPPAAA
jgi:hypothetical protein